MKTALAIVGFLFIFCAIAGMVVKGWNFHAVFADDKSTRDWHLKHAAALAAKLEAEDKLNPPPLPGCREQLREKT